MKDSTQTLVERAQKILRLPYVERVQPMTEITKSLLSLGYNEKQTRRILKGIGVSRSLLFRLNTHIPLHEPLL